MRERAYADGSIIYDETGDWVMGSGVAFPTAILPPEGAPFWRTDLRRWCRYRNGAWSITTWDDLRVDLITSTLGTLNPPVLTKMLDDGAGSEGVWAYAFNDAGTSGNEKAALFNVQMPHCWKEGTTIKPHIHWSPSTAAAGAVKWGLEYCVQNISGGAFPTTSIITGTAQSTGGIANGHLVQSLGDISMAGKTISAILLCRIFRNSSHASDTYAADAFGLYVDFHYEIDSSGSDTEFVK